MKANKTNTIALGGIFLALTIVLMFGASFVPGMELTLYALSSLFVGFMVVEKGPREGLLLFVAAVLLGFVLIPNKLGVLPYMAFFGYYGILKFYIEKLHKPAAQIAVKVAAFAVIMLAVLNISSSLLLGNAELPDMSGPIIFAGGIVMMLAYDVIYTLAIRIYKERVKREKQPEFKLYKD